MTVLPNSLAARDVAYVVHPYTNLRKHERNGPIVIDRGEGIFVYDDEGNEIKPKRAPRKKAEPQYDEDGNLIKPVRKKRAPKPEPVYEIPDVQKLETTYKGRLGYACLNTILRNKKPASEAVFCARTCRIATCVARSLLI